MLTYFTADDKYFLCNCENLTQPIQVQLSKKEKTFSDWFSPFSKSTLNFEHLEKNVNLIAYVLMTVRTPKYVVRELSKMPSFRRPYNKQHGNRSQTLLKSDGEHL